MTLDLNKHYYMFMYDSCVNKLLFVNVWEY